MFSILLAIWWSAHRRMGSRVKSACEERSKVRVTCRRDDFLLAKLNSISVCVSVVVQKFWDQLRMLASSSCPFSYVFKWEPEPGYWGKLNLESKFFTNCSFWEIVLDLTSTKLDGGEKRRTVLLWTVRYGASGYPRIRQNVRNPDSGLRRLINHKSFVIKSQSEAIGIDATCRRKPLSHSVDHILVWTFNT